VNNSSTSKWGGKEMMLNQPRKKGGLSWKKDSWTGGKEREKIFPVGGGGVILKLDETRGGVSLGTTL